MGFNTDCVEEFGQSVAVIVGIWMKEVLTALFGLVRLFVIGLVRGEYDKNHTFRLEQCAFDFRPTLLKAI